MATNTTEETCDLQQIADRLSASRVTDMAEETNIAKEADIPEETHASVQDTLTEKENLGEFGYFIKCLKNYANFKGRARRKEYWSFYLINLLISVALFVFGKAMSMGWQTLAQISFVLNLVMFLPSLAVGVRRLHDIGKSGWAQLVNLIPLVGPFWVLVWYCKDGQPDVNKYGLPPKDDADYINRTTNTAEETEVSNNQRSRNRVAGRLSTIGDTIFLIIVILSTLSVFFWAKGAESIQKNLMPVGIGLGIIFNVYFILFGYITKTLFNGFSELIQISHDTRQQVQNMRQDMRN